MAPVNYTAEQSTEYCTMTLTRPMLPGEFRDFTCQGCRTMHECLQVCVCVCGDYLISSDEDSHPPAPDRDAEARQRVCRL